MIHDYDAKYLSIYKKSYQDHVHLKQINKIKENAENLMYGIKNQFVWKIALRTVLIAGAAFVFIGAVLNSVNFVSLGLSFGLIAACGLMFRYGIDTTERKSKEYVRSLESTIQELRGVNIIRVRVEESQAEASAPFRWELPR